MPICSPRTICDANNTYGLKISDDDLACVCTDQEIMTKPTVERYNCTCNDTTLYKFNEILNTCIYKNDLV